MKILIKSIYKRHIKGLKGGNKLKIGFWSNVHGQGATTSNLIAIGIMSVLQYRSKVFLTQSHFNLNNLDSSFLSIPEANQKSYFMNVGIDAMIRAIKSTYLDEEIIENCSLSYMNNGLVLLPATVKKNRQLFEEDLFKTITSILHVVERYHALVMVDVSPRENQVPNKILESVDLLVINLRQNLRMLNDYEDNFLKKFQDKNKVYLSGCYDSNSRYSITNLRKQYSWLRGNNVGIIPYNTEFMDSLSEGKAIPFFYKNLLADKDDPNQYFIKEVKKAANLIQSYMEVKRWEKEWIMQQI